MMELIVQENIAGRYIAVMYCFAVFMLASPDDHLAKPASVFYLRSQSVFGGPSVPGKTPVCRYLTASMRVKNTCHT